MIRRRLSVSEGVTCGRVNPRGGEAKLKSLVSQFSSKIGIVITYIVIN